MAKIKNEEWKCKRVKGNNEWECESNRDNAIALRKNGSAVFTKFNCDIPVRTDGKILKIKGEELCGVELS